MHLRQVILLLLLATLALGGAVYALQALGDREDDGGGGSMEGY